MLITVMDALTGEIITREANETERANIEQSMKGPSQEELVDFYKRERQSKLVESDWTQLSDVISTMNTERAQEWKTYRQALRDITLQSEFPNEVVWPIKPE